MRPSTTTVNRIRTPRHSRLRGVGLGATGILLGSTLSLAAALPTAAPAAAAGAPATLTIEIAGAGGGGDHGGAGGTLVTTGQFQAGDTFQITIGHPGASGTAGQGGHGGGPGGHNDYGVNGPGGGGGGGGAGGAGGTGGVASDPTLAGGNGGIGGAGGNGGNGGQAGWNAPTTGPEVGGSGGTGGPGGPGGAGGGGGSRVVVNGSSAVAGGGGGESGNGTPGVSGTGAATSVTSSGNDGLAGSGGGGGAAIGVNGGPGGPGARGGDGANNDKGALDAGSHDGGNAGSGNGAGSGGGAGVTGLGGTGGRGGDGGTGGTSHYNGNGGNGGNGAGGAPGGGGGGGGLGQGPAGVSPSGGNGGAGGITGTALSVVSAADGGGAPAGQAGWVRIHFGASTSDPVIAAFAEDGSWTVPSSFVQTTTTLTSSPNPANFGALVTFNADVVANNGLLGAPSGNVVFTEGATVLATVPVVSLSGTTARAQYLTSSLAARNHHVTATYVPANALMAGSSGSADQTVNAVSVAVTSSANPAVVGQTVTFSGHVEVLIPDGPAPTGDLEFRDGATVLGTVPVNATGDAQFSTSSLAVGVHQVTATYVNDVNVPTTASPALAQRVDRSAVDIVAVPAAGPSVFGQPVTWGATVTPRLPSTGVPTGSVNFRDGSVILGTSSLSPRVGGGAEATFTTSSLSVGVHTITVEYLGSDGYLVATAAAFTHTVYAPLVAVTSSANPSVSGQAVTLSGSITVPIEDGPATIGSLEFRDGATVLGTVPVNVAGNATLTTAALAPGMHQITVTYVDDPNIGTTTSAPLAQRVDKATPIVSVMPDLGPTVYGQPVTWGVTVVAALPGSGTPTGSVAFREGDTTLGTIALSPRLAGGAEATFHNADLTAGVHSITAVYLGDDEVAQGTSPAFVHTVQQARTTIVATVPANPVPAGKPYVLEAAVSVTAPGAGVPTGTVTFKEGTTVIGTAEMLDGAATLTVTTLPAGTHNVTAYYGGDANFATSVSVPVVGTLWTPSHAYIEALYQLLLGRPVDVPALTWWDTYLTQQGGSPYVVTNYLATSSEGRLHQVEVLYQQLLGRSPDVGGQNYWANYLLNGGRFDILQASVLGSAEFYANAGGTDEGFVQALYQNSQIYGRPASADEVLWWTTALGNGMSRSDVVLYLLRSDAVLKPSVTVAYQQVLDRYLDPSGLGFWSVWYVANRNDPWALKAVLAASLEYRSWFYTGLTS